MSSIFPRCSTFLHFPLLSEYIMEPLAVWPLDILERKQWKNEINKRKSKKIKGQKAESGARWLCSAARDEENAPVAATVHRGGWNTAAESGNPLTSVPFMLLFCLRRQLSDIHTRHVWFGAAVRPWRTLVHGDPGAVLSVSLVPASSNTAEPKVRRVSSACPLVLTPWSTCLRWAEGHHRDKECFFY